MNITLEPELEAVVRDIARRQGVPPETVALDALRKELVPAAPIEPRDEWERVLLQIGSDCGVSLSNEAVGSEGLYE